MSEIEYRINADIETAAIVSLYENCGLPRPTSDPPRIGEMFKNSNFVVSAWCEGELVGISRCITDFVWSCYLADLAVRTDFQQKGVGRELFEQTRRNLGENVMILLLSVPTAMEYYPKLGMQVVESGFILPRLK